MDEFFGGDEIASSEFFGVLFTLVGIIVGIVSTLLYRPIVTRLGENRAAFWGSQLRTAAFFFLAFAPTKFWFAFFVVALASADQVLLPTVSSTLTNMCSQSMYGRVLSIHQTFQGVGRMIGPMGMGPMFDNLGHGSPYIANAFTSLVAGVLITLALNRVDSDKLAGQVSPAEVSTESSESSARPEHGESLMLLHHLA